MFKRFGLAGMLFATLAVAPFTINAQERNFGEGARGNRVAQYNEVPQYNRMPQYNFVTQSNRQNTRGDRRDEGRMAQNAREDSRREKGDRDRYSNGRDFRSYGEHHEWNR